MSELPNVTTTVEDGQTGTGYTNGDDTAIVMGCCSSGVAYQPRLYSRSSSLVTVRGHGDSIELAARIIDKAKKPTIHIKLPSTTPGTNSAVDATGAPTGTSVITLSGTPNLAYEGKVLWAKGGTRGTAGAVFDLSLDGGRTWTLGIALGTATTYVIPDTGLTLNFGAGNFVLGEYQTWTSTAPRWVANDIEEAFTELGKTQLQARLCILTGPIDSAADVEEFFAQLDDYADTVGRPMQGMVELRDYEPTVILDTGDETVSPAAYDNLVWAAAIAPARPTCSRAVGSWIADGIKPGMTLAISGSDLNNLATAVVYDVSTLVITFVAGTAVVDDADDDSVTIVGTDVLSWVKTAPGSDTATRGVGSFITDGFHAGMTVVVTDSDSNNATYTVKSVAHKVLTFNESITGTDASDLDVVFTASEPEEDWIANLRTEFDSEYAPRIGACAGYAFIRSTVSGRWYRRNLLYAVADHAMALDLHTSIARVKSGALEDCKIHNEAGDLVEHDERVTEGCIDGRFICARTFSSRGKAVYVALPKMLHAPGSDFVRLHLGFVFDKAVKITHDRLETLLSDDVGLNKATGYILPEEALRIEQYVQQGLDVEILSKKRATSCTWVAAKDADLRAPGAILEGVLTISGRGYLEQIHTTARFARTGV